LTIARHWIANGSPRGEQTLGMFEDWTAVMGGILETAGVPSFLANLQELYERADAEGQEWREFVRMWWAKFGTQDVKVSDLFDIVASQSTGLYLPQRTEQGQNTRLGMILRQKRDQRYVLDLGDEGIEVKLEFVGNVQSANRWRLVLKRKM
jgi:putative DNA primase/helicase